MAIHILLPLDGSSSAAAATAVAIQLAGTLPDAHLTALHVVNVRPASGNFLEDIGGRLGFSPAIVSPEILASHHAASRSILEAAVAEGAAAGVKVATRTVTGVVSDEILKQSHDSDLVVLGIRGRTEDRYTGQGGEMSSWLPQRASVPVLLVPASIRQIKAVALGWDGSDAARHALRAVRTLASAARIPVHAIHVSPDGETGQALLDELDGYASELDLHKHRAKGTKAHQTLVEEASRHGADVLAVGYLGRSKVKDLFFGSSTERLLIDQQLAVLVVR
ncbi:MAG: nucleotide-binding universal stress UspA family protein [Myxococcota bacterium]